MALDTYRVSQQKQRPTSPEDPFHKFAFTGKAVEQGHDDSVPSSFASLDDNFG
jgi:hypothetical protein